jgi:FG-GAP repeat
MRSMPFPEVISTASGWRRVHDPRSTGDMMLGPAGRVETAPSVSVGDRVALRGRAVFPWRALVTAALLSVVFGVALYEGLSGGRSSVVPVAASHRFSGKGLLGLPSAAQGPVSAALGADSPAYRVSAERGGFRASNPAQHLSTSFASSGVSVTAGAAQVGLSLRGVGYGSSLTALGGVAPRVHANRVLYAHPGLSEWYANGPLGLEQGFTLARAPAGRPLGPLMLSMTLSGNVQASLAQRGQSIMLSRAGKTVLRYTGLSATDARGRQLRSWVALEGGQLVLRVDAAGARYPLRIDPFFLPGSPPELTAPLPLSGQNEEIGPGELGFSVALSSDGNTALVGGPGDNGGVGAVWVFKRVSGTWSVQEKLTAPNIVGEEEIGAGNFGASVALSSDGDTALIGGPEDNGEIGAAWHFTRTIFGAAYQMKEKVLGGGEHLFGFSVALSSLGETALIGAGQIGLPGAARVYTLSNAGYFLLQAALVPPDEDGIGGFGYSVALSSDGNTALIGGCCDTEDGSLAGAAWVFTRNTGIWSEQEKLHDGAPEGVFGTAVALSSDGNTALIGSYNENNGVGTANGVGAVRVYTRPAFTFPYSLQEVLKAPLVGPEAEIGEGVFGVSLALSADGNIALIGGSGFHGVHVGAAWLFTRSGPGAIYNRQEMLTGSGEIGEGKFASSVALACESAMIGGQLDNGGVGAAWPFVQVNSGSSTPHWYSNCELIPQGQQETVATSGTLTFAYVVAEESEVTCTVTDQETIENPVGGGAGTDTFTQFSLSSCFIPSGSRLNAPICGAGTPEVISNNLPSSLLISGSRDEITGIDLELKCSGGAVLETLTGTLTPTLSDSVLTFDAGSGALTQMGYPGTTSVIGTDNLTGPPGDERITTEELSPIRPHWYSNGTVIPGGAVEPVATNGVITLHEGSKATVTCKVKDHETIRNPVGGGAGTDEVTEFALSKCKASPSRCPGNAKTEIIARKLPWLTQLVEVPPIRDMIEGIDLEVKCGNGVVLDTYTGTLMPTVGNSRLEFGGGSGELEDAVHNKATLTGTDTLKGPKKDTKITAKAP